MLVPVLFWLLAFVFKQCFSLTEWILTPNGRVRMLFSLEVFLYVQLLFKPFLFILRYIGAIQYAHWYGRTKTLQYSYHFDVLSHKWLQWIQNIHSMPDVNFHENISLYNNPFNENNVPWSSVNGKFRFWYYRKCVIYSSWEPLFLCW